MFFKCHFQADDKEYFALLVLCIFKVLQNMLQTKSKKKKKLLNVLTDLQRASLC